MRVSNKMAKIKYKSSGHGKRGSSVNLDLRAQESLNKKKPKPEMKNSIKELFKK